MSRHSVGVGSSGGVSNHCAIDIEDIRKLRRFFVAEIARFSLFGPCSSSGAASSSVASSSGGSVSFSAVPAARIGSSVSESPSSIASNDAHLSLSLPVPLQQPSPLPSPSPPLSGSGSRAGATGASDRSRVSPDAVIDHSGINFETFCRVVKKANLDFLAKQEVFNIFDWDGSGSVSYKEFLLTFISVYKPKLLVTSGELGRLYFVVFDINDDGCITRQEMKVVLAGVFGDSGQGAAFNDETFDMMMSGNLGAEGGRRRSTTTGGGGACGTEEDDEVGVTEDQFVQFLYAIQSDRRLC